MRPRSESVRRLAEALGIEAGTWADPPGTAGQEGPESDGHSSARLWVGVCGPLTVSQAGSGSGPAQDTDAVRARGSS